MLEGGGAAETLQQPFSKRKNVQFTGYVILTFYFEHAYNLFFDLYNADRI